MRVIVTEYQPAWVEQFEEEAQALKQILKENCLKVEHIGSTSVPNLAAKPIIDFLVIVEEIEKVDLLQGEFERIGYEYMGEFGLSGRRYLRKGPIKRTHHVHIYQYARNFAPSCFSKLFTRKSGNCYNLWYIKKAIGPSTPR